MCVVTVVGSTSPMAARHLLAGAVVTQQLRKAPGRLTPPTKSLVVELKGRRAANCVFFMHAEPVTDPEPPRLPSPPPGTSKQLADPPRRADNQPRQPIDVPVSLPDLLPEIRRAAREGCVEPTVDSRARPSPPDRPPPASGRRPDHAAHPARWAWGCLSALPGSDRATEAWQS